MALQNFTDLELDPSVNTRTDKVARKILNVLASTYSPLKNIGMFVSAMRTKFDGG